MPAARQGGNDTPTRILDVAERLLQRRGFNGFSYADVAQELGLTKASLHYHFAGKAELGEALVDRYTGTFADALAAIDLRPADAPAKLRGYAELYADVLRDERMCLCGMLAAEYETLPQAMRASVIQFFRDNETWVQHVIVQGLEEGTLRCEGSTGDAARAIVSGLEGAMLVARSFGDVGRFQAIANRMIGDLVIEG
jgi:TetR/AcrR family transcriptional regulator, transcriptional repressor for nem operon